MELDGPGLENKWLRLVRFGPEHRARVEASTALDFVWRAMPASPGPSASNDSYFEYVLEQQKAGALLPFAAQCLETDDIVGFCAYSRPDRTHRQISIAFFWVDEEYRDKPFYIAMQALLIQRAVEWRVRRIQWLIDESNRPGVRAIEKLGAMREGVIRDGMRTRDGDWPNLVVFSMVGDECERNLKKLNEQLDASD